MKFLAIARLLHDESGTTTVEYGLIAVMIAVVAIPALSMASCTLDQFLDAVSAVLSSTAG